MKKRPKRKSKKKTLRRLTAEQQAENRRELIARLDRESAIFATAEFAKLGLYQ
jgi:hypothetical protein